MRCPSCGMAVDADQRYAKLVVCAACNATVVLDEQAARLSGQMAVLTDTDSPLYLGATGKLGDKRWTILGRVRYGYPRGFWDEWYLRFDDGETAWISEDESNLTLEVSEDLAAAPVEYAAVRPGDALTILDVTYHVDEKDVARCEGGEGQLPFVIEQGEQVPFLDLSTGERFATLEYDFDGEGARLFHGRRIAATDLTVDLPKELVGAGGAPSAARAGGADARERVVRSDDRAVSLNCNCCGAPLAIPSGGAAAVTCDHCATTVDITARRETCRACQAVIPIYGHRAAKTVICPRCRKQCDISRGEPSLLAAVAQPDRPAVPFRMGQRGRLRGMDVVIVGHLRYREREEGIDYDSDEFLMYARGVGYRWLVMENGHFTLTEEVEDRPTSVQPATIKPGGHFSFAGTRYRVFERGGCEIVWVDGELPWVAKVGDRNHYMDATAPPLLLSAEWTTTEQEWYRGSYVAREEICAAFELKESALPRCVGVAPHQQFVRSVFRKQALAIMSVAALVFAVLAVHSFFVRGKQIGTMTLQAADYAEEYVTPEFATTRKGVLCSARFEAPVDNSWVYLDAAVLNNRAEALFDFSAEMSYYHGRSGGESWREGSKRDTKVFRLAEPGKYRFLVRGQAGTGNSAQNTARFGPPVTITVREGVILTRYYIILMTLCLLWVIAEWSAHVTFGGRKWSESDVADD
jgi:hypothetical protein